MSAVAMSLGEWHLLATRRGASYFRDWLVPGDAEVAKEEFGCRLKDHQDAVPDTHTSDLISQLEIQQSRVSKHIMRFFMHAAGYGFDDVRMTDGISLSAILLDSKHCNRQCLHAAMPTIARPHNARQTQNLAGLTAQENSNDEQKQRAYYRHPVTLGSFVVHTGLAKRLMQHCPR